MTRRLAEVAQKVGVSEATVSRVLNGKPGVSAATREAVLTALDVLGYERPIKLPRRAGAASWASSCPSSRTRSFRPSPRSSASPSPSAASRRSCARRRAGGVSEAEYVDLLLQQQVSGVIFAGGLYSQAAAPHGHYAPAARAQAADRPRQRRDRRSRLPAVSCDDAVAAEQAVGHLARSATRRSGCSSARPITCRRAGSCAARAFAMRPRRAAAPRGADRPRAVLARGGPGGGGPAPRAGVTGIVCASDLMALGAIRAVRRAGLGVPADVSIVGFDDSFLMNCTEPPLTTVRQPIEPMGRMVMELLDRPDQRHADHPRRAAVRARAGRALLDGTCPHRLTAPPAPPGRTDGLPCVPIACRHGRCNSCSFKFLHRSVYSCYLAALASLPAPERDRTAGPDGRPLVAPRRRSRPHGRLDRRAPPRRRSDVVAPRRDLRGLPAVLRRRQRRRRRRPRRRPVAAPLPRASSASTPSGSRPGTLAARGRRLRRRRLPGDRSGLRDARGSRGADRGGRRRSASGPSSTSSPTTSRTATRGSRRPSPPIRARRSATGSGSARARATTATRMPTTWRSNFSGTTWTRTTNADGTPGEWYLHLFTPEQPDLNWSHPDVREEHEDDPPLLVRPRRGRHPDRLRGAAREGPDAARGAGRRRARASTPTRPRRAPRHLPLVALDRRRRTTTTRVLIGELWLPGRRPLRQLPPPGRASHRVQLRLHGPAVGRGRAPRVDRRDARGACARRRAGDLGSLEPRRDPARSPATAGRTPRSPSSQAARARRRTSRSARSAPVPRPSSPPRSPGRSTSTRATSWASRRSRTCRRTSSRTRCSSAPGAWTPAATAVASRCPGRGTSGRSASARRRVDRALAPASLRPGRPDRRGPARRPGLDADLYRPRSRIRRTDPDLRDGAAPLASRRPTTSSPSPAASASSCITNLSARTRGPAVDGRRAPRERAVHDGRLPPDASAWIRHAATSPGEPGGRKGSADEVERWHPPLVGARTRCGRSGTQHARTRGVTDEVTTPTQASIGALPSSPLVAVAVRLRPPSDAPSTAPAAAPAARPAPIQPARSR